MKTLIAAQKESVMTSIGTMSVPTFLSRHWQQRPLLVRQAFPRDSGFAPLTNGEILKLATYDEAESRLVTHGAKGWALEHGPFNSKRISELKKRAASTSAKGDKWTILIQDIQHFSHEAHDLLARFAFLPYARIDDLMVSYAVKGGGVGAHIDSYDVFLLQGRGKRRWQISTQSDHTMIPGAPLKLLKNFRPEQEWVLEEGDMLYLPPNVAHNGIAESDDCVTWSIGFRAPSHQELVEAYLDQLRDSVQIIGRYGDPKRTVACEPGFIDSALRKGMGQPLRTALAAKLTLAAVEEFIGSYLSAPKSHVEFFPPAGRKTLPKFCAEVAIAGVRLDLRSRLFFDETHFFLNGRHLEFADKLTSPHRRALKTLANGRSLSGHEIDSKLAQHLYPLWKSGEIEIKE